MSESTPATEEPEKPWGGFVHDDHGPPCAARIVTVASGSVTQRHYHRKRDELLIILDPGARVEVDDEVLYPACQEKLFVPRGTAHRISPTGGKPVRVLEMSFGEFDEEDFVRLEDANG